MKRAPSSKKQKPVLITLHTSLIVDFLAFGLGRNTFLLLRDNPVYNRFYSSKKLTQALILLTKPPP